MFTDIAASGAAEAVRIAFHSWHAGLTLTGAIVVGGLVYVIAKGSGEA
jgi:hypothetical protein